MISIVCDIDNMIERCNRSEEFLIKFRCICNKQPMAVPPAYDTVKTFNCYKILCFTIVDGEETEMLAHHHEMEDEFSAETPEDAFQRIWKKIITSVMGDRHLMLTYC